MNVVRNEIVLARIAFSDQSGAKVRPVLVVSTDRNNAMIDDVIVVSISSATRSGALTHVSIDPSRSDGRSSGLLHLSFVQCENLFTLDKSLIVRELGSLSSSLVSDVNAGLKSALDLP